MATLVVLNPGASEARKNLTRIRGELADSWVLAGSETEVCEGWEEGRAAAARAASEGFDTVVAGGGDGTINSVVNGLMSVSGPRPVLGILPLGTANDLVRSLGIPHDLGSALEVLEGGFRRSLDAFRATVNGGEERRFALNVSAGGFSGNVDEGLEEDAKERWGPLAYLKTAIEQLSQVTAYEATLTTDDGKERGLTLCNVAVANGRWAGGGVPVAPEALLDDGLLDVVALAHAPVARLGAVVARMAAGRHLDHELVCHFRARTVSLRADPAMRFNVDGELLAKGSMTFEVEPGALTVVVAEDAEGITRSKDEAREREEE